MSLEFTDFTNALQTANSGETQRKCRAYASTLQSAIATARQAITDAVNKYNAVMQATINSGSLVDVTPNGSKASVIATMDAAQESLRLSADRLRAMLKEMSDHGIQIQTSNIDWPQAITHQPGEYIDAYLPGLILLSNGKAFIGSALAAFIFDQLNGGTNVATEQCVLPARRGVRTTDDKNVIAVLHTANWAIYIDTNSVGYAAATTGRLLIIPASELPLAVGTIPCIEVAFSRDLTTGVVTIETVNRQVIGDTYLEATAVSSFTITTLFTGYGPHAASNHPSDISRQETDALIPSSGTVSLSDLVASIYASPEAIDDIADACSSVVQ